MKLNLVEKSRVVDETRESLPPALRSIIFGAGLLAMTSYLAGEVRKGKPAADYQVVKHDSDYFIPKLHRPEE